MSLFEEFIGEFKALKKSETEQRAGISKLISFVENTLLQPHMYASTQLNNAIKKLKIRAEEPMKIAITGQFSSGKSTFLNALLSKNILPTGITPVTSKVNYIRYGDEFSIMVRYTDGREAFFQVENLASFIDQRQNSVEDIDYLTLYAPLNLLKDIVFVDTPGLNSQNFSDTAATETVLKEVDGIIWLSLIDNAGKMSEVEVLERYMNSYQNKSLCVLNQKDKFTAEQVEQICRYVGEAFKKYFSLVVPISAFQAVEARSHDAKIMLENALEESMKSFKKSVLENNFDMQKELAAELFESFDKKAYALRHKGKNEALLKESNIEAVLDFIYKEIQPVAINAKEFALTKDIKLMIESLVEQEDKILSIYENLEKILENFEKEAQKAFLELKSEFEKLLGSSFLQIEAIIEKIAAEILAKKSKIERVRYAKTKDKLFSSKTFFAAYKYQAPKINADEVYKKLFFDDDLIGKMFKQYLRSLESIQDEVNQKNEEVYQKLESEVLRWREPNELIRKNKALQSDIQFANVRKFASKSYENILKPFSGEIAKSFAKISSEFRHVSSLVKFNYQNATEVVIAFLERKIEHSIRLYEENPTQFSVYEPKLEEIRERLKSAFYVYELENMMSPNKSFVSKNYNTLALQFSKIKDERVALVRESKNEYVKLKNELISLYEKV